MYFSRASLSLLLVLADYSSVKAMRILNAELADTMGNLLSRVCAKSLNPRQIYPRLHTAQLRDIMTTDAAKHLLQSLQQLKGKSFFLVKRIARLILANADEWKLSVLYPP